MERHVLERLDGRTIRLRTPACQELPRERCNISNPRRRSQVPRSWRKRNRVWANRPLAKAITLAGESA